jgi:outer membrane protein assembly factor BamA
MNSNIFLDKYKLHFFGDWRYYKFPTNTFGIGNRTALEDAMPIDYSYIRFYQYVYHGIFDNTFIGLGYNLDNHWNIQANADSGKIYNEFIKSQNGSRSVSSGFTVNFLYDSRKNSINAQNGSYVNIQFRPNLLVLGSDKSWQSLLIEVRHYFRFPSSSDNILALWSYNNLTLNGKAPYLDKPSIGWDDYTNTGRGYVPGRFTGNNLLYAESEYRFRLTQNGLLGGVVFANAETLLRNLSSQLHTVIPGGGFGLRLKLNKFSNTNLAIDYGFGIGGSRGFFFNLGEVF